MTCAKCDTPSDCDCGLYGCRGNCNQGRTKCDCWLSNRELADAVNRDAVKWLMDRAWEWALAICIVMVVFLTVLGGL